MAEDLEEAYARGVDLLADAPRLDRRRAAAEGVGHRPGRARRAGAQQLHRRPGWFMSTLVGADDPADALARLPLQKAVRKADLALVDKVSKAKAELDSTRARLSDRLVAQARGAEQLDAKRAQAERLAADIERELRAAWTAAWPPDRAERRAEEASQRAAFADYVSAARTAGTAPRPRRPRLPGGPQGVAVALAQLGSPYVWGAEGRAPSTARASPASPTPPPASPSPGSPGPSTPPTPAYAPSTPSTWSPATWCSSPTTPATRAPSTTSACTSARA